MKVLNLHQRELNAPEEDVARLLDSLASDEDLLWPTECWPPLKLDAPLGTGASGGHGPVRYWVVEYKAGSRITFRFTAPRGFNGQHSYQIQTSGNGISVLSHCLEMKATGGALLSWPLIFRPLHDALIEDSLAKAQASLGLKPSVTPWSLWVRFLRWLISRGSATKQRIASEVP